ncbi:MAG: formate--phosphoribosylaminoimidazolecarboxamide ligase family protein [Euryarchaeota archaeon]|nr:formate--phosphoribosylaminoimidazolecarboxamide ligase family protein [Euryarchaeota archaeon]
MLSRDAVWKTLDGYDLDRLKLGVVASHSALDVCDGAVDEDLPSVAYCQKGREATYARYMRTVRQNGKRVAGCVDEAVVLDRFSEVTSDEVQSRMVEENTLFVPNRSFSSYCALETIEERFRVPLLGSRNMLRTEERTEERDYYWLLEKAGLPFPDPIASPDEIRELSIVKLHHAQKALERGFFTAATPAEYHEKADKLLKEGVIDQASLDEARIERYVIGPVFNFNFFYSPVSAASGDMEPVELLGVDWRFESSLDGHVRLPAPQQMNLPAHQLVPEMTVVGHNSATARESLLDKVYDLAERFVAAAKEHYDPGIIGPFCLQTCVDKDLDFYIYDVAPRIGGGTNVHVAVGHPYGNALWRTNMSSGRRIAREVRRAVDADMLRSLVT